MNFQLNYKYSLWLTDLNFYFIRLFDKNFNNHLFFRKYLKVIIFYIIDVKFTPFSLILFRESICNFNLTYDIEFFSSANIFFFFFCTLFVQPQIICFFNKLWKWIISINKIFAKIFGVVSSWNRRSKKAFVIQDSKYEEKNSIDIFENFE